MTRRVMLTGVGAVSAAAPDAERFVEALRNGRQCFTEIRDPRLSKLTATHAALVSDLRPQEKDPPEVRVLDRNVHLALKAMREAISRAGLAGIQLGPRAGVVMGTCSGGMLSIERHYERLLDGEDPLDADLLFSKRYYTAAKVLAWAAGAQGPTISVVTACAAGSGAIAQAVDLIRSGLSDVVLAGGSDTFAPSTLAGFDALKATARGFSSPFSTTIGLNLGEAAAFWVLEEAERALEREAPLLAEVLGAGLSNDAFHPTSPDPSGKGQLSAMERALRDAGVKVEDIDYVNAHGTGTRANDLVESKVIARLLGERAGLVPVSSTKSMVGHCLGAAGAIEASASVLAARAGFVPPTAGFSDRRQGCNVLDYVPDTGRIWNGRIVLSNSFGFGGNNVCLAIDVAPTADPDEISVRPHAGGRAVVTGLGLLSPLGVGPAAFVKSDAVAIGPVKRFPVPAEPFEAGLVPEIEPKDVDRRLDTTGIDLCSVYAVLAARLALDSAGIKSRPSVLAEVGLVLGLATGPSRGESEHLKAVFESGFCLSSVGAFPYVVPNEVAGNTARLLMLKGHNTVLACGEGAGLSALVSAAIAVEQGRGDIVLAEAADELTERTATDGYRVGLWGPGTGVVPGEGAACAVVERAGAAKDRNAPALCEILGYGLATDAKDPRRGGPEALIRAIETALQTAGVEPGKVDAVACGFRGSWVDDAEKKAVDAVFGADRVEPISVADRVGFAEATLPLFNLACLIGTARPGELGLVVFLSPEGFASAVLIRICD